MRRVIIGAALVAVLAACAAEGGSGDTPARERTAEELAVAWWEWASIEPEATNPVTDTTGDDCARNQPDDVWFLAGNFGGEATRTCTLPAGRPVFLPVLNMFCSATLPCGDAFADATVSATLDGVALAPESLTIAAPGLRLGAGGVLSDKAGTLDAIVTGWWLLLPGLTAGTHTLEFAGDDPSGFSLSISYTLTVE